MRIAVVLFLAVPLSACFSEQQKSLARCEQAAAKAYPSFIDAPKGQPEKDIFLCMKGAGYDYTGTDDTRCLPSGIIMGEPEKRDEESYCFAPSNRTQRWLYRLETGAPNNPQKSN